MPEELTKIFKEWYQDHPLQMRGDELNAMMAIDVVEWLEENRAFILKYLNKE